MLLARCAESARNRSNVARDQREANVFHLAATVLRSPLPLESSNLKSASDAYFASHQDERLTPNEVVRNGWVQNLPRLRDMLSQRLAAKG